VSGEKAALTVRLECLGRHWFLDLDDAPEKVEEWRTEYHELRPHSAIGDKTPMSLIFSWLRRPILLHFGARLASAGRSESMLLA
jgi:transposase InsO family protein